MRAVDCHIFSCCAHTTIFLSVATVTRPPIIFLGWRACICKPLKNEPTPLITSSFPLQPSRAVNCARCITRHGNENYTCYLLKKWSDCMRWAEPGRLFLPLYSTFGACLVHDLTALQIGRRIWRVRALNMRRLATTTYLVHLLSFYYLPSFPLSGQWNVFSSTFPLISLLLTENPFFPTLQTRAYERLRCVFGLSPLTEQNSRHFKLQAKDWE